MPGKIRINIDTNDVINKYKNGFNTYEIAKMFHCTAATIRLRLIAANTPRNNSRKKILDIKLLISKYLEGTSILELSEIFNVDRATIRNRLTSNNIPIRNFVDAGLTRMKKLSENERKALTRNANIIAKGRKVSDTERNKTARGRQKTISHVGYGEKEIFNWCKTKGINFIPQFAIHRYNIDLAIFPLAVEIKISSALPHRNKFDLAKIKYLLNSGWSIIYIQVRNKEFLCKSHANYIISYFNSLRRDPSLIGEYRVLGRNANLKTLLRFDGNQFS